MDKAKRLKEIDAKINAILKAADDDNKRDLTAEEESEVATLEAEFDGIKAEIQADEKAEQRRFNADARRKFLTSAPKATPEGPSLEQPTPAPAIRATSIEFPLTSFGRLRNLSALADLSNAEKKKLAHRFGVWSMAAMGHRRAGRWCADNGLPLIEAIHEEGVNTTGGYLVPPEFDTMMIDLREQYGVFRGNARVVPMSSETKSRPRRTGGLTAYFLGEKQAITESTKGWDRVGLTAKDLYVLSRYTAQLSDDAAISVGDDLAGEIAYAFALKEDQSGFLGDGTSTYGGITGLKVKVTAATASLVTAASGTHTNWAGILLTDFNAIIGKLPQYAERDPAWYCHKAFFANVMEKLAYAAGGNTANVLKDGVNQRTFLGYPVRVSQVLSSAAGTAEVVCYFGDLGLAADFGDRRGTSLAFSTEATIGGDSMFETNEVAIRGWERFDINVHDVGNTSVAGPVVGLLTAS